MLAADMIYAERAMMHLPMFSRKPGNKWNGRCPVCGDSATDSHKARFWIYEYKGNLRAGCFNCNYNQSFGNYLKEYEPDLYREWLLERRKETGTYKPPIVKQEPQNTAVMPVIQKLETCVRCDTLPDEHPINKYLAGRMLPREVWNRFWFTREWPKLVNSINPGTYHKEIQEPRLVIPIFNDKGKIESFQGRAMRESRNKYITIKAHPDATKVYGLDTINPLKTVFFFEGPIDSLFIDNAGAITGGQMSLSEIPYKETRVFVLDNEPFHPDTCKRLQLLIDAGEKVVLWDKAPWKAKDINEMILKEHATKEELQTYLKSNIVQGLTAKLRFSKWKRVK